MASRPIRRELTIQNQPISQSEMIVFAFQIEINKQIIILLQKMEVKNSIKISNGLRMRKIQAQKGYPKLPKGVSAHDYYQNYYGRTSETHKQRYRGKYGYEQRADMHPDMHPVLQQLKDSFDSKLQLWFPKHFAKELGRADKFQRSIVTGFKPKKNPVLNLFQKLNKRLVQPVLREALEKMLCDKEQKKKR